MTSNVKVRRWNLAWKLCGKTAAMTPSSDSDRQVTDLARLKASSTSWALFITGITCTAERNTNNYYTIWKYWKSNRRQNETKVLKPWDGKIWNMSEPVGQYLVVWIKLSEEPFPVFSVIVHAVISSYINVGQNPPTTTLHLQVNRWQRKNREKQILLSINKIKSCKKYI